MIKFAHLFSRLIFTKSQDTDVTADTSDIHIDQELQRLALRKLFQQQQFSILDGLNEYDEDFSSFSARGELITQDMLRTAKRLMESQNQVTVANDQAGSRELKRDVTKST